VVLLFDVGTYYGSARFDLIVSSIYLCFSPRPLCFTATVAEFGSCRRGLGAGNPFTIHEAATSGRKLFFDDLMYGCRPKVTVRNKGKVTGLDRSTGVGGCGFGRSR